MRLPFSKLVRSAEFRTPDSMLSVPAEYNHTEDIFPTRSSSLMDSALHCCLLAPGALCHQPLGFRHRGIKTNRPAQTGPQE